MSIGKGFMNIFKKINKVVIFDDSNKIAIFEGEINCTKIRKIKGGHRAYFVCDGLDDEYDVLENGSVVMYFIQDGEIVFEKYLGYWEYEGTLEVKTNVVTFDITEGFL